MGMGLAAAAAGLLLMTTAAMDNDDYAFDLFNHTQVAVTQLNTKLTNDQWSRNWLSTAVRPGESRPMRFNASNDDRCEIRTRVTFQDGSYFDGTVDYCGKETLIVTEDEMTTM